MKSAMGAILVRIFRASPLYIVAVSSAFMIACSGNTQPAPAAITVEITQGSVSAMDNTQTKNLSAVVSNDSKNAGVSWSVSGAGTLSNPTTTSVTYNAPATGGAASAKVTATAVSDATKTGSISIAISPVPSIAATPTGWTCTNGTAYTYTLAASGGTAPLTWSVSGGTVPTGMGLDATGTISGTPNANATQSPYAFTVKVQDSVGVSATHDYSMTIDNPPAPVISSATPPAGTNGTAYAFAFGVASGGLAPFSWSETGTLPSGLTLSAAGALSGTPSQSGSFPVAVAVQDSSNPPQTVQGNFMVQVNNATSGSFSYYGTQSPGDAWSWAITRDANGNGTFSGVNNTSGQTYSGDVATLSNLFLQLTITATTDTNVAVGSIAYAIEFPNTALIVKPAGTKDSVIIAAAQGNCPSPSSYNWIKVANQTWDVTTDPAFGTAATTGSASSLALSVSPYLLNGTPLPEVSYTGSCGNGIVTTTTASFGVTPSGVFIGDQGTNGGIIGMLQPSALIGTDAVVQQGRQFRGFVFMTHPPFGPDGVTPVDKTQAIWGQTSGNNLITAGEYTDFANGIEDSCPTGDSCATLSLDSEMSPGEFSGTMTDNHAGTHPFTLMINQINGKYMIFGFSQNQAGSDPNALYPYLLVVMEQ